MRGTTNVKAVFAGALLVLGGAGVFGQQPASTRIEGGRGGRPFYDPQPPAGARVVEVRVRGGDQIDSIEMILALPDGRIVPGPRHGGSGGTVTSFRLGADEYITGISGRSGDYIDSLRIHTNRRESPLFGGSGGNRDFRIVVPEGNQAVGFVGRAGDYIDAVGLAYTPIRVSRSRPVSPVAPGFSSELGLTALAGGRGGKPFQDSALPAGGRIAEIQIRAGERIDAVQVIYTLPSGRYQEGVLHGGSGGAANVFRLDPDEYVIGISGRCGDTIDSLRIHTNRRSSPLYGGGGGSREYRIDVPRGTRAVGFAGRAGDQVDAIALTFVREGR